VKTTASGIMLELTQEQKAYLDELMERWNAAVRYGFKRVLDGLQTQDVRVMVQGKFGLNSRQANDAVFQAQSTIASQHALVQMHYSDCSVKVGRLEKNLKMAKSQRRKSRLSKKLEKWQRKLAFGKKHVDAKTFPSVVFGGKRNFRERCKGNISKDEWLQLRASNYLSRGDKTKGGNLNMRLRLVGEKLMLDIVSQPVLTEKTVRYQRISVPVYVAEKKSNKTGRVNGIPYRKMLIEYLATGKAYQVEINKKIVGKDSRYYIHVTFEEEVPELYKPYEGTVGVDTNPTGLAVAFVDYLGQYRGSFWSNQGEWPYARTNRKTNLIGEAAKYIAKIACGAGMSLAVEDLAFRQDKSVTAKFNRMANGFCWSQFLRMIERSAARMGIPLTKVPPPCTSTIGILKYSHMHGLSSHESASYVIARRALGFHDEKVPKPLERLVPAQDMPNEYNWKTWNTAKRTIIKAFNKGKKRKVKNLGFWQQHRKEMLGLKKLA